VSVYRPSEAETTVIGGIGREKADGSINLEIKDLEAVTEQNPLDFLDVSSLNGCDLPTRHHPVPDGFPTIRSFNPQRCSPAVAEAVDRISEVRRALSQPVLRSIYT
jgi:hypothetical protein